MKRLLSLMAVLALVLAACGGGGSDGNDDGGTDATTAPVAGDAVAGEETYSSSCVACHGPDAKGIEGLGKDLTNSEFLNSRSDAEVIAFLKEGRPAGDPDNMAGIDMPPKGGNPSLTDSDMADITAYLRTLPGN